MSSPFPAELHPHSTDLERDAEEALAELRDAGLDRRLRRIEGRAGPRMRVDGREVLMLAGSNYLDLAADPRVVAAARQALERDGVAAGGSRLISGNLGVHEELEEALAEFSGTEAALVFGSGYLANLGVIGALAGPGDVILSDELNHASIIDACRLSRAEIRVFAHNDVASLASLLGRLGRFRRRLLVVDGVFSMDGDMAPLEAIVPLARAYGCAVIVDDAHGVGVLGPNGRGALDAAGVTADLMIGNLAKAFGSYGAYVACSRAMRELLVNTARSFIFTCALPPAAAAAALAALAIARTEPERREALGERAGELRETLRAADLDIGASSTHIVPIVIGDEARTMALAERALDAGIYAQGIRYPAVPRGAARLRLTPMSSQSAAEIAAAAAKLVALGRELGV